MSRGFKKDGCSPGKKGPDPYLHPSPPGSGNTKDFISGPFSFDKNDFGFGYIKIVG